MDAYQNFDANGYHADVIIIDEYIANIFMEDAADRIIEDREYLKQQQRLRTDFLNRKLHNLPKGVIKKPTWLRIRSNPKLR